MTRTATRSLAARVARHFSEPEWFTLFELPLYGVVQTPDGTDRSLDALAISRIAGRGNELVGVEIKSDRGDWLKELATPAKAEAWTQLLDRFYLVAGKGVAKVEEVPTTWGFLEETGSGLRVVRRAPPLEAVKRVREAGGEPVPRELWVRVLRRTLEHLGRDPQLEAAYMRGHAAGVKETLEEARSKTVDSDERYDRLLRTVRAFQDASGLEFVETRIGRDGLPVTGWAHGEYQGQALGEAVKVVLEHRDVVRAFASHLEGFERTVGDFRKALEAAGWKPERRDPDLQDP
jgi:hypothetical protein